MEIKDFVLLATVILFGAMLSVIGLLILAQLRGTNRKLDCFDDRAREDRMAFEERCNREDRKPAEERARADCEDNRTEHARLFSAINDVRNKVSALAVDVSDLRADVKVLLERSHRSGAESQNG